MLVDICSVLNPNSWNLIFNGKVLSSSFNSHNTILKLYLDRSKLFNTFSSSPSISQNKKSTLSKLYFETNDSKFNESNCNFLPNSSHFIPLERVISSCKELTSKFSTSKLYSG